MGYFFLYSIILLISQIFSQKDINISKDTRHFTDIFGRVRIFHGVNIVVKNPPYTPIDNKFDPLLSLSDIDYDYLVEFGFTGVRLGVIWEAIETSPGVYNNTYLDIYENIINKLGERGIYTILDSHQDMFSRILCGEGVPIFYAQDLIYNTKCENSFLERILHSFGICSSFHSRNVPNLEGIPLVNECKKHSFIEFHQTIELGSIYHSFFNNLNNIQDKFINYWKVLATRFKNNKFIIGYDIWNEPWVGNLFSDYENLIPGYFTNKIFLPFYRNIDKSLREIDKDFVLMFEEAIVPDTLPFFGGIYLGGYKTPPAGEEYLNKQIWSQHHYCMFLFHEHVVKHKGLSDDFAKNNCGDFAEYKIRKSKEKADELGVPVYITEFGACSEGESCYYEIKGLADSCDRYHLSWSYWMYKPYGDHTTHCDGDREGIWNSDGSVQSLKLKALTRPYILAYQGFPLNSFFYTELDLLYSKFKVDYDIDEYTILYINKNIYFPRGFNILFLIDEKNHQFIYKNLLISSSNIVNGGLNNYSHRSKLISNVEDLYNLDENYLHFKIEKGNTITKTYENQNLELILCPRLNYTISENQNLKNYENLNLGILIEDIFPIISIATKENIKNILNIETDPTMSNEFEVLMEFKYFEDLDDHKLTIPLIKPVPLNEDINIDQIYILKMRIEINLKGNLIYEIDINNIMNNKIKIQINKSYQ